MSEPAFEIQLSASRAPRDYRADKDELRGFDWRVIRGSGAVAEVLGGLAPSPTGYRVRFPLYMDPSL